MRGAFVADENDRRSQTHDERLMQDMLMKYIADYNLSWAVGKFSGAERWPLKWYDVSNASGQLTVTDRAFEAQIMVYGAPGIDWHWVHLEYRMPDSPEWLQFRPSEMLPAWAAACGDPLEEEPK